MLCCSRRVSELDVCGLVGEEEDLDAAEKRPGKMLPHYKALQQEAGDFDIKAKHFYFTKTEKKEDEEVYIDSDSLFCPVSGNI